tara:strand:- start:357 stop:1433 length:1077 start_codon:yes stop_codon:yes gene_type:complete
MSSASNPISLDENTVFFDNKNIYYTHRELDTLKTSELKNTWFYDIEKNKIVEKFNCYILNTLNINLFVGLDSNYCKNNIVNSNIYLKDTKLKSNKIYPFTENESYKGNNVDVLINPMIVSKTYGLVNPDALFEKISEEPFEDIENIEDVTSFFKLPSEVKYPRYFNHYSLSRLNSNISVFGTIEEIDGSILTEKPIKGITCELIKNGTDARNRSINFSESITLRELEIDENNNSVHKIETYSDEEYTDLITGNDELLKRSFSYDTKIINGQVVTVFNTSNSTSSLIPRMSNKVIFYSEDDNNISPFRDLNIVPQNPNADNHSAKNDYNVGNIYPSHGHDRDNSQGSGPDSIGHTGELD